MLKSFVLDFIIIPFLFYIAVAAGQLDLTVLRKTGWLFDVATTGEPWYHFYTYLSASPSPFTHTLCERKLTGSCF